MFYTKTYSGPLGETLSIIVSDDGSVVRDVTEADALHQQYLAWLAEGNTPEPWNHEEVE